MWRKKVTELKGEIDNSPITFGDSTGKKAKKKMSLPNLS